MTNIVEPKFFVNDCVMVHFPNDLRGKAWKFARPYYGPDKTLCLPSTNAEVKQVDHPNKESLIVALDYVRPCYNEIHSEVWLGYGAHGAKKQSQLPNVSEEAVKPVSTEYTGPSTRAEHASPS